MSRIRLSIIVPMYNVEQWLLRCLKSLYEQNLQEDEYEVIVVNDGSTDNSLQIADDFAIHHANMRVITRKNGGLSAARNTGMEYAQGEYVWFVDSDDWIEKDSIKDILEFAENNDLDAMGFFFQLAFEDGIIKQYHYTLQYPDVIFNGEEFVCKARFICSPWATIYKKSYLDKNSLRFMEGILHEDEEFSPRAQFLCDRIAHTNKVVYNYFQREGSIMKSSRGNARVDSFLRICDSLYEFMHKHANSESLANDYFRLKILFSFSQALSHYSVSGLRDLLPFKSRPYYPLSLPQSLSKEMKIKGWLINHSLKLYISLLRLQKNNIFNRYKDGY